MTSNQKRYGFDVGTRVTLRREADVDGVVLQIDGSHDLGGCTTCLVVWNAHDLEEALSRPPQDRDIQWSNKLVAA